MRANKYGLVIGCSYHGTKLQLNGTINDAQNMRDFFEKFGYKGYDGGSRVVFMHDKLPSSSPLYPKKDNILTQFRAILEKAQPGDDVVVFYAGHGDQMPSNALVNDSPNGVNTSNWTNDTEQDGRDEAIIPTDVVTNSANVIVDDTINKWIRVFGKEGVNVLLIFDCCHSGTMSDLKYTYNYVGPVDNGNNAPYNLKNLQLQELPNSAQDTHHPVKSNVVTISGCRDEQVSYEDIIKFDKSNKSQGVLSSSLRYVINSDVNSINDVFKIMKGVMFYTRPYKQHPVVSSNRPLHTDASFRAILTHSEPKNQVQNIQSNITPEPLVTPAIVQQIMNTVSNTKPQVKPVKIQTVTQAKPQVKPQTKPQTKTKPQSILRPNYYNSYYSFTTSNMFKFLL